MVTVEDSAFQCHEWVEQQPANSRCCADEDLGEHFQDREGWRQVVNEGRAAGWLISMQEVLSPSIGGV